MVFGKLEPAWRNRSRKRNRSWSKIPFCQEPLASLLPKKSTSELGRRSVTIFVWLPIGPCATTKGSLDLPIILFTSANSLVVMVAVMTHMGDDFTMCTLTPNMLLSKSGLKEAQWPGRPFNNSEVNTESAEGPIKERLIFQTCDKGGLRTSWLCYVIRVLCLAGLTGFIYLWFHVAVFPSSTTKTLW